MNIILLFIGIVKWWPINLVLMEVITFLISMIAMMMIPEASLGCPFSYLFFYFGLC